MPPTERQPSTPLKEEICMGKSFDHCSTCKNGYLKPTGEVVAKVESTGESGEIGSKRVYQCDNCKRRRISMGLHEYIDLGDGVKTEFEA